MTDERIGTMDLCRKDGVSFLRFHEWSGLTGFSHAFSTREGGVSEGYFSSMNLSYYLGDREENVDENYRRFCAAAGFRTEKLVSGAQVHETRIREVGLTDCGQGVTDRSVREEADGLCTNVPGVTLVTYHADCVPLYFIDPVRKCIALSHAGWRGTVANIAGITVETLRSRYGSRPEDLIAGIGPCICKDCYEVDETVAEKARLLPIGLSGILFEKGNGKYLFDLARCNRDLMIRAGMDADRITLGGVCTMCRGDLLYSHRGTGGKRGVHGAFLRIDESSPNGNERKEGKTQ